MEEIVKIFDAALGTETVFAPPTVSEFSGHHAYILDFQSYIDDEIVMSQALILIEVENGALSFTFTYFTEEQLNDVIAMAGSITFSK